MIRSIFPFGFIVVLWGTTLLSVQAAEIRLKNSPIQCSGSLVTLADIADVLPMNKENPEIVEHLRQIVLFPAPSDGEKRTIDQWQLRSLLSQLGISSLHHYISGAEKITIGGTVLRHDSFVLPNEPFVIVQTNYLAPRSMNAVTPIPTRSDVSPKAVTDEIVWTLEEQVAQALCVYLNFTNRAERPWEIAIKLTPEQANTLATSGQIVEITGGRLPYTGAQQFQIRMASGAAVMVNAMVTLPTEIVVLCRTLPKGYIISEADVMLQRVDKVKGENFFLDIHSVVGKETVRKVGELTPLTASDVRLPLWVRQGEVITIRGKSGGITVRMVATALQDGVEGDTITVAKISSPTTKRGKKEEPVTFLARVCAPKTAEVFVK